MDSDLVLVLDTESRTDASQRLTFGSARLYQAGELRREWLFYGDDLPATDLETLSAYRDAHADNGGRRILLMSRSEFVEEVIWKVGYELHALIVGYNLPFDLSRLAVGWRPGRKAGSGGFSLQLYEWTDPQGKKREHLYRPNVLVRALGSKRQLISFAGPSKVDPENKINGQLYRGRFLDLHALTFALTDDSLRLDDAAGRFGLEGKRDVERHGEVTPDYIDYNRHDVHLTHRLFEVELAEWERHPIELRPEQAFSPATVGRAYFRSMGVVAPLAKQPDFPREIVGAATVAYYGGRSEIRIRGVPMPVRYVDFTSMYSTVFGLENLWSYVIADRFEVDEPTAEVIELLSGLTHERLHDPASWPAMAGVFCLVEADGELLPVRAPYGADPARPTDELSGSLSIGLNPLWCHQPLWYPVADLAAAQILGDRSPKVLRAVRVRPSGVQPGLRPIRLRGQVQVDPRTTNLFRIVIEERQRAKKDPSLSTEEGERLNTFLKTFANATSYGIFFQMDQDEPVPAGEQVEVDGLRQFSCMVHTPEKPGEFCFPPLAATITGGARLLLALAQADVEARGGSYLACDTDSLVIVSSRFGGGVACPGGPERLADGREAVKALSWAEVDAIIGGIDRLNPYSRDAVPSLLKLEDENFDANGSGAPVELWALGISAKRFALYVRTDSGPLIRKASDHGLGMYCKPVGNPPGWKKHWPAWTEQVWCRFIDEAEGRRPGPDPLWFDYPAVGQISITTPAMIAPFRTLNRDLPFLDQVKPGNFMLMAHDDPWCLLPDGVDRQALALIAPYSSEPSEYLGLPWRNRYDGRILEVTTAPDGEPGKVRLQTYRDVIRDYRLHPEFKSADPNGGPCLRGTIGQLGRRPVVAAGVRHIGKESNRLEEVEIGLVRQFDEAYVEYRDPRGEWEAALPALRRLREEQGWRYLAEGSGLSERAIRYALNGGKIPHPGARQRLVELGLVGLDAENHQGKVGDFAAS